jgi:hypothetical protein
MSNQAYPLCWPAGWPRTQARESGKFKTTLSATLNFLRKEVELLGGKNLVLSSNCTLGNERPSDPGVVAYFSLKDQPIAIPCDRWFKVEDNVRAIGLTIEAMRGMERWGAKHMIKAIFQGFKALPAQSGDAFNCWTVLGVEFRDGITEAEIVDAYKKRSLICHPDRPGGSNDAMAELNRAKVDALHTIGRGK